MIDTFQKITSPSRIQEKYIGERALEKIDFWDQKIAMLSEKNLSLKSSERRAPGIYKIRAKRSPENPSPQRISITVGVHGDEVGGIQVADWLLETLSQGACLKADALISFVNLRAIKNNSRTESGDGGLDSNRQMKPEHFKNFVGPLDQNSDHPIHRAMILMQEISDFKPKKSFDLHQTFEEEEADQGAGFCVVYRAAESIIRHKTHKNDFQEFIENLRGQFPKTILNESAGGTFTVSGYASQFGCATTIEMGIRGYYTPAMKQVQKILKAEVLGEEPPPVTFESGELFRVVGQLMKISDDLDFTKSGFPTKDFAKVLPSQIYELINAGGLKRTGLLPAAPQVLFVNDQVRTGNRAAVLIAKVSEI